MNIASPFVWGSGGRMMTPEEIEKEKQAAEALAQQGMDFSPVQHWTQGAARVATALAGAVRRGRVDSAQKDLAEANKSMIASLLGGGGASAPSAEAASAEPPLPSAGAKPPGGHAQGQPAQKLPSFVAAEGSAPNANATGVDLTKFAIDGASRPDGISGFKPEFSAALTRMISEAPPEIQAQLRIASGYRSPERQAQLWEQALKKYGDPEVADNWVAPPGRSNHNHGQAADLKYLSPTAKKWVHENAARYGLALPLGNEPWHVELSSARGGEVKVASANPSFVPQGAAQPSPVERVAQAMPQERPQTAAPSGGVQRVAQAIDPNVINVLTSPYASPATREVAKAIMQQRTQQQQLEAQQAYDRMSKAEQRAYDAQVRQQGWSREDQIRAETWKREDINKQVDRDFQANAPTPDIREYNFYVKQAQESSQPVEDFRTWQQSMKKAGATNVTQTAGGGDDFYKELDKKAAAMFAGLDEEGYKAQAKAGQIDRLEGLLTAAQENALPALRQVAGEYGIKTDGLDDIQAAQALINELVPQQRLPGSGPMSDADLALYKQSLPRIINQPGGNKLIIDTMRGINQYTMDQAAIARAVANRDITPKEGRERLAALQNPLADFKKLTGDGKSPPPAAPKDEAQKGPVKVSTPDEAMKLPKGTKILLPDGTEGVVP